MTSDQESPWFGILTGNPIFECTLDVNGEYMPDEAGFTKIFERIFERQYYTNQGPLAKSLEDRLQHTFGVRHAICVTNATIGFVMAFEAMHLTGCVLVPAMASTSLLQALAWTGLEPLLCDVDESTHLLDANKAADLLARHGDNVAAIVAINLWGNVCDVDALRKLADRFSVALIYDSVHAYACAVHGVPVGKFGGAEVFSLFSGKVIGGPEGGVVCTNDDELAARLRNIRSSYGAGPPVPVAKTSNGRMSEAQAALGLMHLEDYPGMQRHNQELFRRYEAGLSGIPGLRLLSPANATASNFCYVVCQIDSETFGLDRDTLEKILNFENIGARHHQCLEMAMSVEQTGSGACFQASGALANYLQLPTGIGKSKEEIDAICVVIARANEHAAALARVVR